ncbi:MAG: phosphoribosylaminoimidazolesuccinocarboxamide synthase [Candidatus Moranbacteria bacterium]|nr:phosphoribosylaminoimidazolesuccinocarboxamide synthase [bacterium]MDP1833935.1 phosphoribosylaminoimidazolesuccinocarboxamide synthase [Candidatus Moranbacteria bacterium]
MGKPVVQTNFGDLRLLHRGKVRDIYEVEDKLLIVATDRVSAFDVVMDEPIPNKGAVLTGLSIFWFDYLRDIVPNHLISVNPEYYPEVCAPYREQLRGRSMLVKKANPLPVECIVRGYLSGSFWKAYQKNTTVCGFALPSGMRESERLPEVIFTPSTKAELGTHDENISLAKMAELVGQPETEKIAAICKALYCKAADYARKRGIIIADTKFELGWYEGELILIDEVLTPDSSRFWPAYEYEVGKGQPSFDKQFLRDYLSSLDWNQAPPAPVLPPEIIDKTKTRYQEAFLYLTGHNIT